MAANSLGRGQMRPHNAGRTPSFVVVGLMIVIAILGFNYWNVSSKNSLLAREVNENRDRIRIAAVKKLAMEKRNDALMQKVRTSDMELNQEKTSGAKLLQKKSDELDGMRRQVETKQEEASFHKLQIEQTKIELERCKQEMANQLSSVEQYKQGKEECDGKLRDLESKCNGQMQQQQTSDCTNAVDNERTRILKVIYRVLGVKAISSLQQAGINTLTKDYQSVESPANQISNGAQLLPTKPADINTFNRIMPGAADQNVLPNPSLQQVDSKQHQQQFEHQPQFQQQPQLKMQPEQQLSHVQQQQFPEKQQTAYPQQQQAQFPQVQPTQFPQQQQQQLPKQPEQQAQQQSEQQQQRSQFPQDVQQMAKKPEGVGDLDHPRAGQLGQQRQDIAAASSQGVSTNTTTSNNSTSPNTTSSWQQPPSPLASSPAVAKMPSDGKRTSSLQIDPKPINTSEAFARSTNYSVSLSGSVVTLNQSQNAPVSNQSLLGQFFNQVHKFVAGENLVSHNRSVGALEGDAAASNNTLNTDQPTGASRHQVAGQDKHASQEVKHPIGFPPATRLRAPVDGAVGGVMGANSAMNGVVGSQVEMKPKQGAEGQLGAPAYNGPMEGNIPGHRVIEGPPGVPNTQQPPKGVIGGEKINSVLQPPQQQQKPEQQMSQQQQVREVESDLANERFSPVRVDVVTELYRLEQRGGENGDGDQVIDHDRRGNVRDGDVNSHERNDPEVGDDYAGGQGPGDTLLQGQNPDTGLRYNQAFYQPERQPGEVHNNMDDEMRIQRMRQQQQQQQDSFHREEALQGGT